MQRQRGKTEALILRFHDVDAPPFEVKSTGWGYYLVAGYNF